MVTHLSNIRAQWNAFHFCSRRLEGASVDPRSFIRRLVTQFASSVPEYAHAALRVLSPPTMQVNLTIGTNLGKAVGVRTEHLWVTGHSITDGFSEVIKAPIELLAIERPDIRFALLVDGLDEALGVGGTSIAHLVASMADLPDNVKVLVSTKKDRRVRDLFPDLAHAISLEDVSAREYNRRDILSYVRRRTSRIASEVTFDGEWAPENIAGAADQNFQYARHLIDEIEAGSRLRGQRRLPESLPVLYRSYLDQLIPHVNEYGRGTELLSNYLPLLELLSVTFAPIPSDTVATILGWSASQVATRADELQQLIDFGQKAEPELRFFHSSAADFITVPVLPDQSPNPYHAAPGEAHNKLANRYLTSFGGLNQPPWNRCDAYGLTYLVEHIREALASGAKTVPDDLYKLAMDATYRKAQTGIDSSDAMLRTASTALDYAVDQGDTAAIRKLIDCFAMAPEPQLQGLAATALAKIYPTVGKEEILRLLMAKIPSVRQVGLNAAYQLGFAASDLFRAMALAQNTSLPRMAAYMAYLKWTSGEREIVMTFADEIAKGIRIYTPREARARLQFLGDATAILYTNLAHDRLLIEWGDRLWREVLTRRLHIGKMNHRLVSWMLASAAFSTISQRLGEAVMVDAMQSPDVYFRGGTEPRKLLNRAIDLLDPRVDLRLEYDSLTQLLSSDIAFLRVIGSIVLSSHFCRSRTILEPFLKERFVELPPRARLWHLIAFSVLAPTDSDWSPFVAWQTAYILKNDRATVVSRDEGALKTLNFMLLPLGLSCGKSGTRMTEVEEALRIAVEVGDRALTLALIEGLAIVGLYFPAQALSALSAGTRRLEQIPAEELIDALATMSVLHPQAVDVFLEENGRTDLRIAVHARANVTKTRRAMDQVGFFSATVYQFAWLPIMREKLCKPALRCLAESYSITQFVRKNTRIYMRLIREYDYHLGAWMEEDASRPRDTNNSQ
jgi:hypothetical protein